MSGTQPSGTSPGYATWQDAALGGNLASYLWANRPGMDQLVPGSSPSDSAVQKMLDLGSVPARFAASPLLAGGAALERWMAGDQGPETRQMVTEASLGLIGTTAIPLRPSGTLGIFGGPMAKTADMKALRRAMDMEGEVSRETLWNKTGWFRGVDGEWKFEIPDTGAKWTDQVKVMPSDPTKVTFGIGGSQRLGDILEHPELFKAYPELENTSVHATGLRDMMAGVRGGVYQGGTIGLSSGKAENVLSTGLHEVQHKVQTLEGFGRGGNPGEFLPASHAFDKEMTEEALSGYRKILNEGQTNSSAVIHGLQRPGISNYLDGEVAKARKILTPEQLDDLQAMGRNVEILKERERGAFEDYKNLAGEVESRTVQERHAQGEYQRPPWRMEGYPAEENQIVKFSPMGSLEMTGTGGRRLLATPVPHDPFGGEK